MAPGPDFFVEISASSSVMRAGSPPRLTVFRARARCTRICRMESAAIARKCVRFCQVCDFSEISRTYAS